MKWFILLFIIFFVYLTCIHAEKASTVNQNNPDIFVKIPVNSPEEAEELVDLGVQIELNMVVNGVAEGFVSPNNLELVRDAGFTVTVVEPEEIYTGRKPWYDFDDVVGLLTDWNEEYPEMTHFDTAGYSINGKPVLQFRLSGSPDTAARQRIYFSGACHGNEKIGTETCMLIISYLLENYSSDPEVKELVDRSDFVFHPILNVDGFTSSSQGRRTLANGNDPNRAFGWKLGGKSSDGSLPYQWPEMKTYLYPMIEAPSYLSLDYHAGMKATLDPFFAPVNGGVLDKDAYSKIGDVYPPMSQIERWEEVYIIETRGGGVACDGSYGKCGNISLLPEECNHYPPESDIERISQYHMDKFLDVIDEMQKGVYGRITDARDGSPVYGRIQVKDNGAATMSDPRSGAFYKYIPSPSGTFDVTVFANGYKPATKSVQANSGGFANVDFELEYDADLKFCAASVDVVGLDNEISQSEIYSCLESPDSEGTDIDGFIVVDFGAKTPVTDQDGAEDLTVHGTSGTYTVSIHYDVDKIIDGEGVELGSGSGTKSFDLSSAGIDSARWVRIDASSTATIDAFEAAPREIPTAVSSYSVKASHDNTIKLISPAGLGRHILLQTFLPKGPFAVTVYDLKGRPVSTLASGNVKKSGLQSFYWDGLGENGFPCSNGTYVFHIKCTKGERTVKSLIVW
jgi:hypothetical protein